MTHGQKNIKLYQSVRRHTSYNSVIDSHCPDNL